MLQIRKKVFETNSSSTHSFTYDTEIENFTNEEILKSFNERGSLITIDNNKILITLEEYGWERRIYRQPDKKISYILTMLKSNILENIETNDKYEYLYNFRCSKELKEKIERKIVNLLKETETFNEIENFFKDLGLKFTEIEFENIESSYVDHQSLICEETLLKKINNDIIGFIINKNSYFETDNDNY